MNESMHAVLSQLAEEKANVQVKLRGDLSPIPLGPGLLSKRQGVAGIYQIDCEVTVQTPGGAGGRLTMPFLFSGDDVLHIGLPPATDQPRVQGVGLYGGRGS